MTNKERADKLKRIMANRKPGKMTARALSRATGLHYNTIRNALDGKHSIDMSSLQKIAVKLAVNVKTLV